MLKYQYKRLQKWRLLLENCVDKTKLLYMKKKVFLCQIYRQTINVVVVVFCIRNAQCSIYSARLKGVPITTQTFERIEIETCLKKNQKSSHGLPTVFILYIKEDTSFESYFHLHDDVSMIITHKITKYYQFLAPLQRLLRNRHWYAWKVLVGYSECGPQI